MNDILKRKTVGILTLGCKVNQYESEAIAERCEKLGMKVLSSDDVCDAYVINTCTVTAEADRKSCQMIRQLHRRNPLAAIIVCGCSSQRNPETIRKIEGVSAVIGNIDKLKCADLALSLTKEGVQHSVSCDIRPLGDAEFEKMSITAFPRTRQYIKIEDGCENHCAYCAICDARGPVRSKNISDVLSEAKTFIDSGCREIVLTGIETASFGKDTKESLADLLCEIEKISDNIRIRLGSVDPTLFRPAFLEKTAKLRCMAPHFHISMQSGSSHILAKMRRRYNADQAYDALKRIREAIPGVMFTTDIIVGFPGETEEDFELTRKFITENRFLMTHIFPFSPRKGTEAADMPDKISKEEKQRRCRILAEDAKLTRKSLLEELVGTEFDVLFETEENGLWHGHSASFVETAVHSDEMLHGQIRRVRVTGSNSDICTGVLI